MKIVFVHIPKTAGGTVKNWFSTYCPDILSGATHQTLEYFENYDYSFSITRNTYKRLISLYVFSCNNLDKKIQKRIDKGNTENIPHLKESKRISAQGIIPWLEWQKNNNERALWDLKKWTQGVDIILRQENLDEDFKKIQNLCGCKNPLVNNSPQSHVSTYNYKEYCTNEYIQWVEKNYSDELEEYNYEPY